MPRKPTIAEIKTYLTDANPKHSTYTGMAHLLVKHCEQLQAQLDAIKPIADYANYQADMAQSRLLKQENLYDDTYWQPVLDEIRFELLQLAAIKGDKS